MMPMYAFTSRAGETIRELFSIGKVPRLIVRGGIEYKRDFSVVSSRRGGAPIKHFEPYRDGAVGVSPSQAAEAEAQSIRDGCPTKFCRETGDALIESSTQEKKLYKSLGATKGK